MAHNRPIAPAPENLRRESSGAKEKKKVASLACDACKRRKTRCGGEGVPCDACVARATQCIFEDVDQRRKSVAKRRLDELEQTKQTLEDLILSFRSCEPTQIAHLVSIIRGNTSLAEIAAAVQASLEETRLTGFEGGRASEELQVVQSEVARLSDLNASMPHRLGPAGVEADGMTAKRRQPEKRPVMDVGTLCDMPPYQVPAKPWTTVTKDDGLVSHLVSLYFTWQSPHFDYIEPDLFVEDMVARRESAEFCSPLLVNVILAMGCNYSPRAESCQERGNEKTRGRHFWAETERLWKDENGRVSIVNMQALCVMQELASGWGFDQTGTLYGSMAISMAQRLGLPRNVVVKASERDDSPRAGARVRARIMLGWGMYCFHAMTMCALMRGPALKAPNKTLLPQYSILCDSEHLWQPYPLPGDPQPSHRYEIFHLHCELGRISSQIAKLHFADDASTDADVEGPSQEGDADKVDQLYRQLLAWKSGVPASLDPVLGESLRVFYLHQYYHTTVIILLRPVLETFPDRLGSSYRSHREIFLHSAHEIARIERIRLQTFRAPKMVMAYHNSYGATFEMHPVAFACPVLLQELADGRPSSSWQDVTTCLRTLRGLANPFPLAQGIIKTYQILARQLNLEVPLEIEEIFNSLDENFSATELHADYANVSELLGKWEDLEVND